MSDLMTRRTHLIVLLSLLVVVVIGLLLAWRQRRATTTRMAANVGSAQSVSQGGDVFLNIFTGTTPSDTIIFELVNKGRSTLVCPDTWGMEFDNLTFKHLSLPVTGNLRIAPGSTGTIAIVRPFGTNAWRLATTFYMEDLVFDAKVKVAQSGLKDYLPDGAVSIHGKVVKSDWVK
jgi:hypothetical protein